MIFPPVDEREAGARQTWKFWLGLYGLFGCVECTLEPLMLKSAFHRDAICFSKQIARPPAPFNHQDWTVNVVDAL